MAYDKAFAALSDPTRRKVFELVSARPRSVARIAGELPISQPAVSHHLKVLREAGLVIAEPKGASNIYRIDPQGLAAIRTWLDRTWEAALDAFQAEFSIEKEEK
ncbi:winged helix-turn-helix transcriptional regulator [Pseudaminobacter sp. 19-2017]|uniref:Winged helix-turn-helix transcriptional regulator n=1 Tax=Pseudaminobacter soli (ex Zhang et al. 2022) TaxID=2831468 RepID=A0A942E486_9HYPH|nr:metalloregulator ArsR/SmtB family transcription factor [Pseudaminobacter soli]MBS3650681.1 winged helix-turn-helix transcriptional regulator [Pseudaminobacter soli]